MKLAITGGRPGRIRAKMVAGLTRVGRPMERSEFYLVVSITPSITAIELNEELGRMVTDGVVARIEVSVFRHYGEPGLGSGRRRVVAYELAGRKEGGP